MITEQEKIVRESQGYDLGFEFNGKKYWLNTNDWNEEKEERFRQETGLCTFREETGNKNLVVYNPEYFEVISTTSLKYLHYKGEENSDIPQPINMSSMLAMFYESKAKYLNILNWDTSNIQDFTRTFAECRKLVSLDLSTWDLSNTDAVCDMFYNCKNLNKLNLSNWNVKHIKSFQGVFFSCNQLETLKLQGWELPLYMNVIDMFTGCTMLHERYGTLSEYKLLDAIINESNSIEKLNAF